LQAGEAQKNAEAQAGYAGTLSRSVQINAKIAENTRQQNVYASGALKDLTKLAQLKAEAKDLALQSLQLDQEFTKTQEDLAIARLDARGGMGDAEAAAAIRTRQANEALSNFTANGGTKDDPEYASLQAGVVAARRAQFDVGLQAQLDTLDFQKETYKITSNQEIQALQEILKNKQLTLKEQRDITLKIKNLQEQVRNQLTGSGFNIPTEIKLPTAYAVRRSLGLNPMNTAGTASTNYATNVVNNTVLNNTVSSPAMVHAIATQVVNLINTQTATATRSNQTSPALVRY